MDYLAIIQARCGSSRLPGKILMDLGGKPVLRRVIERVEQSAFVDEAVVATTFCESDVPTVRLVAELGRRVFAGSENDVLDRFYQAAKLVQPQYVIRVTADCPVYDWKLLDDAIGRMAPGADYLGGMTETLPDGLDIEVVKFSALADAWQNAHLASEREHVTLYIKNHPERFGLQNYDCPMGNYNHERWTLDEAADYELLRAIYAHFGKAEFGMADILDFLDANPHLRGLNGGITRNEGLAKSLKEDREV